MRYYIADLHFFHENLNTKMDKRGFANVNAMNDYMLKQWNSKVRNRDEVVILGDLSWGKPEETNQLLQKLNGRLYLIQGNHDRFFKDPKFDSSRFEWVKMYEELNDNKRKVVLCHYPIMCYNGQYKPKNLFVVWTCTRYLFSDFAVNIKNNHIVNDSSECTGGNAAYSM